MDQMRRNLFKAGVTFGAAAATVLSNRAWADDDKHRTDNNNDRDDRPRCFLRGTKIRTFDGEASVEDLRIGEELPTLSGPKPILFVSYFRTTNPAVVIKANAICTDVPDRNLCLTLHHAILIDGILVDAGNLINGSTIYRDEAGDRDFFHVLLADHSVVFAHNTPCESLHSEVPEMDIKRYCWRGRRALSYGYLRSALSPIYDLRNQADLIRDRLDIE